MTVRPEHAKIVQPFLADLREAAREVAKLKPEDITAGAALYSMIGILPDRGLAKDITAQYLNELYQIR